MESLKHPATIIGIADFIGIVGVSIYFHKKISELQAEVDTLSGYTQSALKKIDELQKLNDFAVQVKERFDIVNRGFKSIEDKNEQYEEQNEEQQDFNDAVVEALKKGGITIELPDRRKSKKGKKSKKEGKKEVKKSKKKIETSEEESSSSSGEDLEKLKEMARRRR